MWAAPLVVETPRGRVAVRSTNDEVQRLLDDALPGTGGAPEPWPQGFGVRPAEDDSSFHWLYWGRCPVVRTRDADRLLGALEQHLSAPVASTNDWLVLRLSAAVTADGGAILLPAVGAGVARIDRRLREAGATLVDAPFAVVDPHTGDLVLEPPSVALREEPRRELVGVMGSLRSETVVAPGRYPLARWAVEPRDPAGTPAAAAVELLGSLAAPTTHRGAQGAIHLVSRLRSVMLTVRDVRTAVELLKSCP